jgi:hypothetical protein
MALFYPTVSDVSSGLLPTPRVGVTRDVMEGSSILASLSRAPIAPPPPLMGPFSAPLLSGSHPNGLSFDRLRALRNAVILRQLWKENFQSPGLSHWLRDPRKVVVFENLALGNTSQAQQHLHQIGCGHPLILHDVSECVFVCATEFAQGHFDYLEDDGRLAHPTAHGCEQHDFEWELGGFALCFCLL